MKVRYSLLVTRCSLLQLLVMNNSVDDPVHEPAITIPIAVNPVEGTVAQRDIPFVPIPAHLGEPAVETGLQAGVRDLPPLPRRAPWPGPRLHPSSAQITPPGRHPHRAATLHQHAGRHRQAEPAKGQSGNDAVRDWGLGAGG